MLSVSHIVITLLIVALMIKPLGGYMAAVFSGIPHITTRSLGWLESLLYRLLMVDDKQEMRWREYAFGIMTLSVLSIVLLFMIFMTQGMEWHTALNASISFTTNTNWQSYTPETALSNAAQALGIVVQMFISPAVSMAVAIVVCRAFARKQTPLLGNCWVDIVRGIVYILLPLSFLFALILAALGVVQNFHSAITVTTLEGSKQIIMQGPVAFQTAIKMLGTNGGGFFSANAAHPYENPNALSNILQMISILLLPAAFVYTAGIIMRDRRQAYAILAAMTLIFLPLAGVCVLSEKQVTPKFNSHIIETGAGNLEGKEIRFGAVTSAFWTAAATATGNGSANSAINSNMPVATLVPMIFMQLGEVVYGGLGSGLYTMVVFVLLTVFVAGLMVGRTPEFLGKKIGIFEIKMGVLVVLLPSLTTLVGTAIAVSSEAGRLGVFNPGPRGLSEILYAFTSASNNNGSMLSGIAVDTPFYNAALALCMLIGRYAVILCMLAIAGSVVTKNIVPQSAGTLPTHNPLFVCMLVGVVMLLGMLTYIPVLALSPVIEHIMLVGAS